MYLSTHWELEGIQSNLKSADDDTRAQAARHAIGLYRERSGMQKIGEGYYGLEPCGDVLAVIYDAVDSGSVKAPDVVEWVAGERRAFAEAARVVNEAFAHAMSIPASELNIKLAR